MKIKEKREFHFSGDCIGSVAAINVLLDQGWSIFNIHERGGLDRHDSARVVLVLYENETDEERLLNLPVTSKKEEDNELATAIDKWASAMDKWLNGKPLHKKLLVES